MKKSRNNYVQKSISKNQLKELQLVGQLIRELRFNYGVLSQKDLAEKCGVHFNTIQAIERGNRNYNIISLLKIINFFEYDLSTFIKELF
jgi:transcriptional regulator with XRE-family HTH domain